MPLREACDATLVRLLVPGAWLLVAFYTLISALHLAFAPPHAAVSLVAATAGSALVFAGLGWILHRHPPNPRWAHPIATAVAALVLANIGLFLHFWPAPTSAAQIAVLALCAGMVLLSRPWLAVELVGCVAAWLAFALANPPFAAWVDDGYLLAGVCLASALVHEGRLRAVARNEASDALQRSPVGSSIDSSISITGMSSSIG